MKRTGSARRESQRGTILIKDRAKSDDITGKSVSFAVNSPQGSVIAPTPLSPVFSSGKSTVWEEYSDVLNSMRSKLLLPLLVAVIMYHMSVILCVKIYVPLARHSAHIVEHIIYCTYCQLCCLLFLSGM